ncbi:MAG: Gfo/Idh/MocA family oxidoreductase [Chloroflexi bacterium]|nr:Gfo/Idh/MocA family oxidoreductase [Chloroflexota bacterium]
MKFLIAGLGSIGRRHLRNLIALGERDILLFRTHHVNLPDADLASFLVETDLQKALATKPDAVIVSNPTSLHLEIAIPSASAGCSLLMEKPLSANEERLSDLQKILAGNKRECLVGFQFRFHPAFQQIDQWMKEGRIGKIISANVIWGEYLPGWHPWEDYRNSYSARQDLGGGVVLTLCHPIDYLRWMLGEVEAVSAFTGKVSELELQVEDMAEITMQHTGGTISHIHLDYFRQPKHHDLEIVGSNGTISWDETLGKASLYDAATGKWLFYEPSPDFERNTLFLEEMRHFLAILSGSATPVCSLGDGIRVQKIIAAVYRSASENQRKIILSDDRK